MALIRSDADAVRGCGILLAAFADQLTAQRRRAHHEFAQELEAAQHSLTQRRARVDEARVRLTRATAHLERSIAATNSARAALSHAQSVDPRNGGAALVASARVEVDRAVAEEWEARTEVETAERELKDRQAEAERCAAAVARIDGAAKEFNTASTGFSAFTLGIVGYARPRLGFLAAALDQYHAVARPDAEGPVTWDQTPAHSGSARATTAEVSLGFASAVGLSALAMEELKVRPDAAPSAYDSWAADRWARVVSRILERGGDRGTLVTRDARDGATEPHTLAGVWDWMVADPILVDADGEVLQGAGKIAALRNEGITVVAAKRAP